jgi:sugar O-acyltransferase (sialic acid O-acetyltransferase NeuD family)
MQSIFIVGASGHGRVVADAVAAQGLFAVAGFVDDRLAAGERHNGVPIVGGVENLPALLEGHPGIAGPVAGLVIALGDNFDRHRVAERARRACPGLAFVTVVHPRATVAAGVELGAGSVVCAGAVVGPGSRIGEHTILNTNSSLDHDSELADFASLGPGVVCGGSVRIGSFCALGIGAVVKHGVAIGAHTVVGAGAVVLGDLPSHVVAYGTPASVVRARPEGEPYL